MSTNEKLPRVTSKIFASNAAEGDIGQFGSALTGTKVNTDDISVIQGLPAYETGWRGAVVSDRNYPTLQEMNGLQKTFSQQIAYILQNGMPEWDAGTTYFTDQFCRVGSKFYVSLQDNNLGNNPTTTTGFWQVWDPAEGTYANKDLSNLSTTGQAVLDSKLNENQITNCILSAPNGVATYSGITVTVPELTSFLFPNGRNTDNTLKNINFSLASNATGTIMGNVKGDYIAYVTSESEVGFSHVANYYVSNIQPTSLNLTNSSAVWFNPSTNILSFANVTTSTPSWNPFEGALCATLSFDGTSITSFKPFYPIELLKQSDKSLISDWGMPSNKYIELTFGASDSTYTAPANGYLRAYITSTGSASLWTYMNVVNVNNFLISRSGNWHNTTQSLYTLTAFTPMLKGQTAKITYVAATNITEKILTFVYVEGEM